jgi:hypothetical protein
VGYQVLCLALNVPLTPRLLKEIGASRHTRSIGGPARICDDALAPLDTGSFRALNSAETLQSFLNTYAEGVCLCWMGGKGGALASMLGLISASYWTGNRHAG